DSLQRLSALLDRRELAKPITIHDIRAHVVAMKDSSDDAITEALESLRQELGKNGQPAHYNRYMNWDQVKEMRAAGIDFASHALSHRILCRMSDERCCEELQQSKALLESQLGEPVRAIAYPNGDHDERVIRKTREAGYTLAFATTSGLYGKDNHPLSIPRMNVHENNSRDKALFLCATINLF
ncbi:MAG: polysaccharide deacetylase family protein, partial [Woeseia sp.]